jgi:hypothetical protein
MLPLRGDRDHQAASCSKRPRKNRQNSLQRAILLMLLFASAGA